MQWWQQQVSHIAVGHPSALEAWPGCGSTKRAGPWVRGAEKGSVHWLQPNAAGLSRLFVKHQPLFVVTPIESPSGCLPRGTQSKSRETDESAIGLLAVACPLPVDFHASKSKLKA